MPPSFRPVSSSQILLGVGLADPRVAGFLQSRAAAGSLPGVRFFLPGTADDAPSGAGTTPATSNPASLAASGTTPADVTAALQQLSSLGGWNPQVCVGCGSGAQSAVWGWSGAVIVKDTGPHVPLPCAPHACLHFAAPADATAGPQQPAGHLCGPAPELQPSGQGCHTVGHRAGAGAAVGRGVVSRAAGHARQLRGGPVQVHHVAV